MSDGTTHRYNAVCTHCGTARFVWLASLIGAAPVFCVCGAIMTLSGSELAVVKDSPSASKVRRVEIPPSELCLLGMMHGADGKQYPREEVFRAIMRHAFFDESGLEGYKLV